MSFYPMHHAIGDVKLKILPYASLRSEVAVLR